MLFLSGDGFSFVIRDFGDAGGKILRELWGFPARLVEPVWNRAAGVL
jgi:hypothetical protein